ncbi:MULTISPECIES: secretion/conjugation apparatus DotM-related subunit [Gluconobacter]|uniref:secretion/conjugation apparatus DotM-related subunit n=1 Tax=Gluconobacter TaxID=441 RepID=UPI001B8B2338|nr:MULTISPECIES: hypothetical protein [Gluconobacter]MBS1028657.1 hypothetical protein [Gluconobacter albidus]MBS1031743.1 hypothetical protein [Gluconobacter cerinus]MBS1044313.1 hypothetical protein [Gluconobacter cerinus]MBS1053535.1 hypothetical protein [Gluconobacter kondonii]MBS1056916.1 hypothetical protein [Gluconobacter kondonii]
MPVNPAPNTRSHDPERIASLLIGVCVGIALFSFLLWLKFHTQIVEVVLFVQGYELRLIGLFTHRYDAVLVNLGEAIPERVSASTLWALCTLTGSVLRWPALVLLVILAGLCLTRAPLERHRKRFGLEGLQKALAEIHPLGAAWLGKGLKLVRPSPPEVPLAPLDPALNLDEWRARYVRGDSPAELREATLQALQAQLGRPWRGPLEASAAEKCLFVAFSFFIQRRKDEAQNVLESLSVQLKGILKDGAPSNFAKVPKSFVATLDKQLKKEGFRSALKIAEQHAFTRPALLSLLQEARLKAGVVNPGLFAAIQFLDRDLWLVLSAASYPRDGLPPYVMAIAACPEAAAALAHWKAECVAGHPLTTPQISSLLKTFGRP